MIQRPGERGYASIAAIIMVAVLALVASTTIERGRSRIEGARADLEQAKAAADADAGLAMALDGLLVADRAGRWSIDGRDRSFAFDDARLTLRVEDERGKVPLNLLDDQYAQRLVEVLGMGNSLRGRIAAESLIDWIDSDEEPHPNGAEAEWYRSRGIHPRNAPLQSIDELASIRGFDSGLVARMRGFVTVNFGAGGFDARFAMPEAMAVMLEGGDGNPLVLQRRREMAGQRAAIELGEAVDLIGRPLTVVVDVRRPGGARMVRRTVIELTGAFTRPYVVRSAQ